MQTFLIPAFGYLIGSISFAVMVAKSQGIDIFKEGSGNPGATNIRRMLGPKWGRTVFFLDALKGVVSAGVPIWIYGSGEMLLGILGLIGGILGHTFPIFFKFRGGKGVATAMGGLLILMPLALLSGVSVWLVVFYSLRVVAIASIAFSISLPVFSFLYHGTEDPRFTLTFLLSLLIIVRHAGNIARFIRGKEHSFKNRVAL